MPKTPEVNWGFSPDHPFIYKITDTWDISQHTRLSDLVIAKHLKIHLTSYPNSLLAQRAEWLFSLFPELSLLKDSDELLLRPFVWTDLVKEVKNIGTHKEAQKYVNRQLGADRKVAYWTGGLEFTNGQYQAASYLINKGFGIVLGVEPLCFPSEFGKARGPLSHHITAVTIWSKFLNERGFVFNIPRPFPDLGRASPDHTNDYYNELYQKITGGRAYIVVSENDPFKTIKQERGPFIEIPYYTSPSTTELYRSSLAS